MSFRGGPEPPRHGPEQTVAVAPERLDINLSVQRLIDNKNR